MAKRQPYRNFTEAMAWPYPPKEFVEADFPSDFLAVLDEFDKNLAKARSVLVVQLRNMTKAELVETLAAASIAAMAHHAMLEGGRVAGRSMIGEFNRITQRWSKGGAAKAKKSGMPAKRQSVEAAWATYDKRGRGAKTRFTTAQAAGHGVSPRTIESWIAGK